MVETTEQTEAYCSLINPTFSSSGTSLTSMGNGLPKIRIFVACPGKSLNLVLKFSAKEPIISIARTLRKGTLTDPSL